VGGHAAPDRRNEIVKGLQQGGVTIERLQTREGTKEIEVPDGLIHHWVGTVFVPRITVKDAVALMQDYDRHSKYFAPAIARSKTLEHHGDRFRVALRFHVKKVITVTMDTENEAEFFHPSDDRAYSRIRSTRTSEIADAGTAAGKTETCRRRKRLHVESQHLLALRTARRRDVYPMRIAHAHPRRAVRPCLDHPSHRHADAEGITDLHPGKDTQALARP
jgi:hypothetical protein